MKKIIVVGGGASGMMAALTAAENPDHTVLLFERQARVGRKLLSTGNGRCNLTNTLASPEHFHGRDCAFSRPALEAFPPRKVLEVFRSLGLVCSEQYGGRVFPLSESAGSVLDVLRFALAHAGVEIHTGEAVKQARRRSGRFLVSTESSEYDADALIIACGGKAGGKLAAYLTGMIFFAHSATAAHRSFPPWSPSVRIRTIPVPSRVSGRRLSCSSGGTDRS